MAKNKVLSLFCNERLSIEKQNVGVLLVAKNENEEQE
jgi:hypothetical protein